MQVATLFRESSTLLGAAMESGGSGVENLDSGVTSFVPGPLTFESYHHSMSSKKYKLNMKLEPHEDAYKNNTDMLVNTASVGHSHEQKCEKMEDPYSFIDDDPIPLLPSAQGPPHFINSVPQINSQLMPGPKKRGRKKRNKSEGPEFSQEMNGGILRPIKERKKHDRFNGMPEEEVSKRTLPDHLSENLDIIIIGINPGLFAAYKGHHYAGPGNHFWKCLYLSGLTPQQMSADEDYKLLQVGIGFTNMVQRATKGSADLTRKEIKEGSQILLEKLRKFKPKIAVFNGKLIFEVFSGKKDFKFGRQPDVIEGTNTHMWVMPSSSARCAQLPRAADKVPFYTALKKFRDYLNGLITEIDENEMVFSEPRVKSFYEAEPKPEPFSSDLTDISNVVIHNDDSTAIPYKKKRGRPKKSKVDGDDGTPKPPVVRKPPQSTQPNDNCNFPKKKRGRPKKIKIGSVDQVKVENNTSNTMSHCYSNLSPMRSLNGFYQMGPTGTTPNANSNSMYPTQPHPYSQSPRPPFCQSPRSAYNDSMRPTYNNSPKPQYSQSPKMESQSPRPNYSLSPRPPYSQSPRPQYSQSPRPSYSQSPRPHSQPFTHSDLSSEISAAISSEQLASPIGPPDFEPLTNMEDEAAECRLGSPSPSPNSEQSHYYHQSYNLDPPHSQPAEQQYSSPRPSQDIASKSLSGLESLVDQIPSLTEGDGLLNEQEQYSSQFNNYNPSSSRGSPVPYNCPPSSAGYPIYPPPTWSSHYEPIPFGYPHPQLPYGQGYGPGLHVPSPDYPYYSYSQPTPSHPPGYPSYLGGF